MEVRNRIKRVKKALPNLGGRANQLPPLETSAFKSSKRSVSYSSTNPIIRKSNQQKIFGSRSGVALDLNQSSAEIIPINSMYEGESERQAAIPAPMTDDEITMA